MYSQPRPSHFGIRVVGNELPVIHTTLRASPSYSGFQTNPEFFVVQHQETHTRRESIYDQEAAEATRCRFGPPEIAASEIIYDEELDFIGEGVFGRVYKGQCRQCSVAVKVPRNQLLNVNDINDLRHEVALMSQIFHPNVVLFMGACTQPGSIKIVTERMMTDMEKFLRSSKGQQMLPFIRFKMAIDAAKGFFFSC
eukprot:TRINITY_DN5612_c0_g2_i13.p1 TRINITY_DN5612_c0_g2~~TRINITY_DN5612_c0_g2_i13.p1  ORF type:complete len:196 (-),score=39.99 TRINITY_DN5612_c0_g2_i13:120-707(-)